MPIELWHSDPPLKLVYRRARFPQVLIFADEQALHLLWWPIGGQSNPRTGIPRLGLAIFRFRFQFRPTGDADRRQFVDAVRQRMRQEPSHEEMKLQAFRCCDCGRVELFAFEARLDIPNNRGVLCASGEKSQSASATTATTAAASARKRNPSMHLLQPLLGSSY